MLLKMQRKLKRKYENYAINFMYPNSMLNPDDAKNNALLAVTNNDVNEWNARIQELNPNT